MKLKYFMYYNKDKIKAEEIEEVYNSLPKKLKDNTIILPKTFQIIECNKKELLYLKETIESTIKEIEWHEHIEQEAKKEEVFKWQHMDW